jgi:hypothetical protein
VISGWTGCVVVSRGSPATEVPEGAEDSITVDCCVDLEAQPLRISNALNATPPSNIFFLASIDFFPGIFFGFESCPIFIE